MFKTKESQIIPEDCNLLIPHVFPWDIFYWADDYYIYLDSEKILYDTMNIVNSQLIVQWYVVIWLSVVILDSKSVHKQTCYAIQDEINRYYFNIKHYSILKEDQIFLFIYSEPYIYKEMGKCFILLV